MRRFVSRSLSLCALAVGALAWGRASTGDAELAASADPAVIERGAALVYGAAHCGACHLTHDLQEAVAEGGRPPLSGGRPIPTPFGTFYTPNLTPDPETGIGAVTDAQLVSALRHNVGRDGRALAPFMAYQDLSDEDLVAILSFLRAQEPVHDEVPAHELNLAGRLLLSLVARPVDPTSPPPETSPAGPTVARGEYLANDVAQCVRCHSPTGFAGGITGQPFSGGRPMPSEMDPRVVYVPPNLTADPRAGALGRFTEDAFVARFRSGAGMPGTHMPWGFYRHMTDDDLRAIWRYLSSLEPVDRDPGPMVKRAGML
jgi:mono/diheme cytochrome c family protein